MDHLQTRWIANKEDKVDSHYVSGWRRGVAVCGYIGCGVYSRNVGTVCGPAAVVASIYSNETPCPLKPDDMVFGFLTRAATTFIGTLLPAYRTFRSVEKSKAREMRHWMRYWAVYGFSSTVVNCAKAMMLDYLIPGSDLILLIYACWLAFPVTGGTDRVYLKYIRPFLRKHEQAIDTAITTLGSSVRERITSTVSEVAQHVMNGIIGVAYNTALGSAVQSAQARFHEGPPSRPMIEHIDVFEEEQQDDDIIYIKPEPVDEEYEVHEIRPTPRTRSSRRRVVVSSVPEHIPF
ncbi:hypothetical protein QR680_007113 [Steinernema hermaphroditum]|uniref:Receptor expression-enhancing protein n=1 Tax=Steinernema hermaphroditum TaxID=289476 RepID=A0AA39HXR6_9BILA|nr:hypothetical protein QR680_007113 [Steinernema hermaphroditum]